MLQRSKWLAGYTAVCRMYGHSRPMFAHMQWDVMTDSDACSVVRRHLHQAGAPRQITPPQLLPGAAAFGASAIAEQMRRPVLLTPALATAAAERLVQESLDRGTMDNVTAIVGLLQWD